MGAREQVTAMLKAYPSGIAMENIARTYGISEVKVTAILTSLAKQRKLAVFTKHGIVLYTYYDWPSMENKREEKSDASTNSLQTEMVDGSTKGQENDK